MNPDNESMTPIKRVVTVTKLQEPDRVPINPIMSTHIWQLYGITTKEGLYGIDKPDKALRSIFDRYGGWDHISFIGGLGSAVPMVYPSMGSPLWQRVKVLGIDLPDNSPNIIEHIEDPPLMDRNGYDHILDQGFFRYTSFRKTGYLGLLGGFDPEIKSKMQPIIDYWVNERKVSFVGPLIHQPFEILVFMRNMRNFLMDLIRQPDRIKAVLDMSIDGFIEVAKRISIPKLYNLPKDYHIVQIQCLTGGGGSTKDARRVYSPKVFEELYFPYLKRMVNKLYAYGYRLVLHLDSNWTDNLTYLRELPKGSIAWLELDGATDIFKAKELIGDRIAISGDVPAPLLTHGSPSKVEAYCRELIDRCGEGGGFILGSGCEIPQEAKFENVKALIDTGKKYGIYRR